MVSPLGRTVSGNCSNHKPPYTGPLQISNLNGPNNSVFGLTNCPGRNDRSLRGKKWDRDLLADFKAIEDWNTDALISLNQAGEFTALGVPEFEKQARTQGFKWYHLPILDFGVPGPEFNTAWDLHSNDILKTVTNGGRLVIHCAFGLGRSGTLAAKILTTFGVSPEIAIKQVRNARPGAIESQIQEQYITNGQRLDSKTFKN